MFIVTMLVPITFYLYAAHPSWAWMYLVNPDKVPGFAILPLVVSHAVMVGGGWYLGARLLVLGRKRLVVSLVAGGTLLCLVSVALLWGRLGHYGSYAEFHAGRALPIMDVKLGYVLVAMALATIASASFMAVELIRDGRRAVNR